MPTNAQQQTGAVEDEKQLKAGHPPAVKVGNMRIVQRTHSTSSDKNDDELAAKAADAADQVVPSACSFAPKTVVAKPTGGVSETVANQSNPEALKQIHEKPLASHDFRGHSTKPSVIMQPKK